MKAKITNSLLRALKATGAGYDVNDTELHGFALRISAQGTPTSYSVRYRTANGRRQRLKVGSALIVTPLQARELAQQALADVTKGDDPQDIKKRMRGVQTLGDFIESEYAPQELVHRKTGEGTVKRLKSCFGEFWNWPLQDKAFGTAIGAWRSRRLGDGRSPGTCNRDLKALKAVFAHAIRQGLLEAHPLAGIRHLKTDSQAVIRYLSDEESERLHSALDSREARIREGRESGNGWRAKYGYALLPDLARGSFVDHLKPMVLLSLHTGLRRGEVFSLEWRDVSFERAVLTVRGEIAKSGKTRHVPLNTVACAVLKEWQTQTSSEGLVFKSPSTGERFSNVDAAWRNLLAEAGIERFRWHDVRHHFASQLVMAGVDLNTVRELLGHGDIKQTLRYAHLAPEHKAAAVAKLVNKGGGGETMEHGGE